MTGHGAVHMQLTADLAPEDLAEFSAGMWLRNPAVRKARKSARVMWWLILALLVLALLIVGLGNAFSSEMRTFFLILVILLLIIWPLLYWRSLPNEKAAKTRLLASVPAEDPALYTTTAYTLTDKGVACANALYSAFYEWHAVSEVFALENYVVLALSAQRGLALPKRCFESDADAERFLECARELREAALLKPPPVPKEGSPA